MGRKGFALIELLVVIAIIAILAAILFPVFVAAKERARVTACISNLRQIWLGMTQYQDDHSNQLPPFLASTYRVYVKSADTYVCKSDKFRGRGSTQTPSWAGDWEYGKGFETVWKLKGYGCSYAYMPRAAYWYSAPGGKPGCWAVKAGLTSSVPATTYDAGGWVNPKLWTPVFQGWTPIVFDWWHAQVEWNPSGTFQSSGKQKTDVLVLLLGGTVKRCKHERQLPCAEQIGTAAHPRYVLR